MAKAKKVRKSIGVLWIRSTKAGDGYYRGYFDFKNQKIPVVAFDNSMPKLNEKSPDIRIYVHEPLGVWGQKAPGASSGLLIDTSRFPAWWFKDLPVSWSKIDSIK